MTKFFGKSRLFSEAMKAAVGNNVKKVEKPKGKGKMVSLLSRCMSVQMERADGSEVVYRMRIGWSKTEWQMVTFVIPGRSGERMVFKVKKEETDALEGLVKAKARGEEGVEWRIPQGSTCVRVESRELMMMLRIGQTRMTVKKD